MRDIVIFMDGSNDIAREYENRIKIIPSYYYFEEDKIYDSRNGLSNEEFYKKLETERVKTCASNLEVIREMFEEELDKERDIICIAFSSRLSSTYNNIRMVAEELLAERGNSEERIEVLDSLNTTLGTGYSAMKAVDLVDEEKNFEEIIDIIKEEIKKVKVYFVVNDFKYLVAGGRVSNAVAMVGKVLNIKPVLTFIDGKIEVYKKARGLKGAFKVLREIIEKNGESSLIKIGNENLDKELKEFIDFKYEVNLNQVVGAHIGPNAIGIVVREE